MPRKTRRITVAVDIDVPTGARPSDVRTYVREAVQTWCKQCDLDSEWFDVGDSAVVRELKAGDGAMGACRLALEWIEGSLLPEFQHATDDEEPCGLDPVRKALREAIGWKRERKEASK